MSQIYPAGDHQVSTNLGLGLWGADEVTTDNLLLIDTAFGSIASSVNVNGVAVPSPANFVNSASVTLSVVGSNISLTSAGGGSGTVTSFSAGTLSPLFTTSVATPAITPALSFSLNTQNNNLVFAGPVSGGPLAPTFRSLVAGDIPALSYLPIVGGIVTAYNGVPTVKNGIPSLVAVTALTAQSAVISSAFLYAVPAGKAGLYRITYSATITTAGTTSVLGGTNGFQSIYTSIADGLVKTSIPTTPNISAANTTGTEISGVVCAYAQALTNIQYNFGYTSTGTAMVYALEVYCEYLG